MLSAAAQDGVLLKPQLGLLLTYELQVLVPEVTRQVLQNPFVAHQLKGLDSAFRVPVLSGDITTLSTVG